jgi:hypothetical protein
MYREIGIGFVFSCALKIHTSVLGCADGPRHAHASRSALPKARTTAFTA